MDLQIKIEHISRSRIESSATARIKISFTIYKGSVCVNYDSNLDAVLQLLFSLIILSPLTTYCCRSLLLLPSCWYQPARDFCRAGDLAAWKDGEPLLRLGILMITHGERKKERKNTRLNCNMERDATVGTHVEFHCGTKTKEELISEEQCAYGFESDKQHSYVDTNMNWIETLILVVQQHCTSFKQFFMTYFNVTLLH